jgi:hypothetical protein
VAATEATAAQAKMDLKEKELDKVGRELKFRRLVLALLQGLQKQKHYTLSDSAYTTEKRKMRPRITGKTASTVQH